MVLVDTSVWIDHFRDSRRTLDMLAKLPQAVSATEEETLEFIERRSLYGRGIGYIDIHLLASAVLSDQCVLWTDDFGYTTVTAIARFAMGPATLSPTKRETKNRPEASIFNWPSPDRRDDRGRSHVHVALRGWAGRRGVGGVR